MQEFKKDLSEIKEDLESLKKAVYKGFEERRLDMTYEIEKMRLEAGFNAKNIILILLLLFPFAMAVVFGFGIYKYFQFETQNTKAYIEVENISDNNSELFNSINNGSK